MRMETINWIGWGVSVGGGILIGMVIGSAIAQRRRWRRVAAPPPVRVLMIPLNQVRPAPMLTLPNRPDDLTVPMR